MALFSKRPPLPRVRRNAPGRTIERGLGAIAFLAALLLIAGAGMVRYIGNDTIEASHEAARSYQLKLELENLATALAQAEAGSRAFIMTGKPESLEPYQRGRFEAGLSIAALRPLTSNVPFQSTDVAQLDQMAQERIEGLAKANSARAELGAESGRAVIDGNTQHDLNKRIAELIRVMKEREQHSLDASLSRLSVNNDLLLTAMVSTILLFAVIAFAFWGTLKREFIIRARLEQRLMDTVVEDELTGAINRQAFERLLDQEWAFRLRYATPLSMLLMEIDNIGKVNGQYGLDTGDLLLRDVSSRLRGRLRTTERLARYGGQQFGLVVPQSLNDAVFLARQLSELITSSPYMHPPLKPGDAPTPIKVELSIGVADASDVPSAAQLILAAGEALYAAKQMAGVRVELYQQGMREASQALASAKPAARPKRERV